MCHDGTGLRYERAEARFLGVMTENRPTQRAQERRSGRPRTEAILENRPICAGIAVPLLEPSAAQKTRRSDSKSGSGRWSHWDEIGWVHYPEIGWSHSDEISGVQSLEILHMPRIRSNSSTCMLLPNCFSGAVNHLSIYRH
jgi:hypothetical protein